MKHKAFRRLLIMVLTLVVLTATVLPASAASATQDGITVTLTTDKTSYSANETITVTTTVENKNAFPVEDVKLDYDLPSGYNFKVQGGTSSTIAKLGAGEKSTQTLKHTPSAQSSNVQTGDSSMLGAWLLLAVLSVALIAVLTVLYKKNVRVFSMLLCLVLVAAMLPVGALAANVAKTLTVSETVKVDGKDVTIKATVAYTIPVADEEPEATTPEETTPEETTPEETTPEETTPEETTPTEPSEPGNEEEALNLADMQIVLPATPTVVEQTAAAELNLHLKDMIGKELEIVSEGAQTKAGIYLGETELAKNSNVTFTDNDYGEGWAIKAVDGNLVLRGGATRGTLYAVFHLLEDEFGVRWWNLWETYIPDLSEEGAILPADFSSSGVPAMEYRDLFINDNYTSSLNLTRNRLNGFVSNSSLAYGGEVDYGMPSHCHTFFQYFPVRYSASSDPIRQGWLDLTNPDHINYFDEHPEWYSYSEEKGTRIPNGQLCLSSDGLYEAFKTKLLQTIAYERELAEANGKQPPVYYSITPNDTDGHCECADCKASMAAHGPSGHLLRFVNRLAKAVRDAGYTDVLVEADAYSVFVDVPVDDTVAGENVTMRFSDNYMDIMHAIDHPNNINYWNRLEGWSDRYAEGNLYLWDYGVVYSNNGVFPTMYNYGVNFAKFAEEGVNGYFGELEECINTDFWDMKFWLLTKLMEDPTLACDENGNYSEEKYNALMDDFIYGYYGAAGEYIREFLDLMDEKAQASDLHIRYINYIIGVEWLSVEDILAGAELLDQAFEAAGDDEVLLRRLRAAACGFDRAVIENFNKWKAQAIEKNIELTIDRQTIGARLATGLKEQIEQRGYLDINGDSLYERYSKYLEEPKPLPEELQNIDREHIYDYTPGTNTLYDIKNDDHAVRSDPDSLLGEAVVVDTTAMDAEWRENYYMANDEKGLIFSLWTGSVDELVGKLYADDIIANDGKYHLYKFEDHLVQHKQYRYVEVICRDSTIQNWVLAQDLSKFYGKQLDFYISMKVTGDVTCQDPNNYPVYYIDRVFAVDPCEVSKSVAVDGATCTQDGTRTGPCAICGNIITEPAVGSKLEHSFVDYVPNSNGTKTAECAYGCGAHDTVTTAGNKLPDELMDVDPSKIYQAPYSVVDDTIYSVEEDPYSISGGAVKVDLNVLPEGNVADWYFISDTSPLRVKLVCSDQQEVGGVITKDQLVANNDGQYHFYKIADVTLPDNFSCAYMYLISSNLLKSWQVGTDLNGMNLAGKTVDMYVSLKYTGDVTSTDAENMPVFYFDQLIIVDKTVPEINKLPDELANVDPSKIYEANYNAIDDTMYETVEDPSAISGGALKIDLNVLPEGNVADWYFISDTSPLRVKLVGVDQQEFGGAITKDELVANNDGEYHFYKIAGVTLPEDFNGFYMYLISSNLTKSWAIAEDVDSLNLAGKTVDMYVSLKYTGDVTSTDAENMPVFYFDQLLIVDKTKKTLPDELNDVDPSRIYKATYEVFDDTIYNRIEDSDSISGGAVKLDLNLMPEGNLASWYFVTDDQPLRVKLVGVDLQEFGGAITKDELVANNDGQYHFYKIEDVTLPEDFNGFYMYVISSNLVKSWTVAEDVDAMNLAGKTVDMYVSLKYTGDVASTDELNMPVYYLDQLLIVDKSA